MKVDLLWIASTISALSVILGTAWKLHVFLGRMEKRFEKYDKTINENTIHILKMALLSEDLPLSDRIQAGKLYLDLGGNGYGHVVYKKLIKEMHAEMDTKDL